MHSAPCSKFISPTAPLSPPPSPLRVPPSLPRVCGISVSLAMDVDTMDEKQARQRLLEGGYFVALEVPPGVEFGIDLKSYQVGGMYVVAFTYSMVGSSTGAAPGCCHTNQCCARPSSH